MTQMPANQGPDPASERVGYLSGRWIPQSEMSIAVDDAGFLQSATAVERLRTYGGRLFQPAVHLHRWAETVRFLGIDSLPSLPEVGRLIEQLLDQNARFVASQPAVGVTLFATPGRRQAAATFGMHLNLIDDASNRQRITRGQPLVITDVVQPSSLSWPRSVKVRSRLHYYSADRVTKNVAADATGALVETDGSLTETGIANLALVIGSTIHSPPDATILHGVTQRFVEELAGRESIQWIKQPLTRELLNAAEEILLMGTTTGLWFADRYCFASQFDSQFDSQFPAPRWHPLSCRGPVFQMLRRSFDTAVDRQVD